MDHHQDYLMESEEETLRLDVKTDPEAVRRQAAWCGIAPGCRVLDLGCGSGITTSIIHDMAAPGGSVVGLDFSDARLAHARAAYGDRDGISFVQGDLRRPPDDLGFFDVVWVRFILEYFRRESPAIVKKLQRLLKPGGTLCLIDLDGICLNHYQLPKDMEPILSRLADRLNEAYNFDAYAGRKLYSYLYDGQYENIEVALSAHHLIYGEAGQADIFNWLKKIEIGTDRMPDLFREYPGGPAAFRNDFESFFLDRRRFTYTPLIMAKGTRPRAD